MTDAQFRAYFWRIVLAAELFVAALVVFALTGCGGGDIEADLANVECNNAGSMAPTMCVSTGPLTVPADVVRERFTIPINEAKK